MNNIDRLAMMIEAAIKKMEAGDKAEPAKVIAATGTDKLRPDICEPIRAFLGWGYCDPYFGWFAPALEEAILLLETAVMSEELAGKLWSNGWTRSFLVELYERNDEKWEFDDNGDPELYDKLEFDVRTRKGFVEWLLSGERLYGYNLPGHESLLKTKETLLLRNRRAHKNASRNMSGG